MHTANMHLLALNLLICLCAKCESTNLAGLFPDPGVHFHAGLSDCKAIIGEPVNIECKVSSETCEGVWSKDGEEVSPCYNMSP